MPSKHSVCLLSVALLTALNTGHDGAPAAQTTKPEYVSPTLPGYDTPLHKAATWPTGIEKVRELLAAGADPNAKGERGNTPLHSALSRGRTDSTRALLEAGASVDATNDSGQTPLHVVCGIDADLETIALLIEHGADVKARTPTGVTPLHLASRRASDPRVIDLLVRHGARVDTVTDNGSQPLHQAAYVGEARGAAALIRHGADVHSEWNGRTPLEWAVRRESPDEMLVLLVESGATVDLAFRYCAGETEDDRTLLHAAAEGGATRFARILLEEGADVNARDTDGHTPLHLAIQADRVDMVRILLEAGAAVNLKGSLSFFPKSPMELAEARIERIGKDPPETQKDKDALEIARMVLERRFMPQWLTVVLGIVSGVVWLLLAALGEKLGVILRIPALLAWVGVWAFVVFLGFQVDAEFVGSVGAVTGIVVVGSLLLSGGYQTETYRVNVETGERTLIDVRDSEMFEGDSALAKLGKFLFGVFAICGGVMFATAAALALAAWNGY